MTRYIVPLHSDADRERVIRFVRSAPEGSRVEIKGAKRSLPQNDRMWAMLSDVATQKEHFGRKYKPEIWKILFMHSWQCVVQMIPSLDGTEIVPLTRSSDLSKEEMTELIEFMFAWGAENGVQFHDSPTHSEAA